MHIVRDKPSIYDRRFDKYRHIAVAARIKRWRHCGGRGACSSHSVYASTDSPLVRFHEYADYDRRLGYIVFANCAAGGHSVLTSLPEVVENSYPYNQLSPI